MKLTRPLFHGVSRPTCQRSLPHQFGVACLTGTFGFSALSTHEGRDFDIFSAMGAFHGLTVECFQERVMCLCGAPLAQGRHRRLPTIVIDYTHKPKATGLNSMGKGFVARALTKIAKSGDESLKVYSCVHAFNMLKRLSIASTILINMKTTP